MSRTGRLLRCLYVEESGQDLIEYALIGVLVGLGAMASMRGLAGSVAAVFAQVGTTLSSAT